MSDEKHKGLSKEISDKFTAYFHGWFSGRKGSSGPKNKELFPPPKCSRCFSDIDEKGQVDCFYPYHVEGCVCSKCMTDAEKKMRDESIAHYESKGKP